MNKNNIWTKYLWLCLFVFGAFLLEYFSLFIIEMLILQMDLSNYTASQRSIHHLIMVLIWIIYICSILFYSKKLYKFPPNNKKANILTKDWIITFLCLAGCKIMTFIDWHTLKVIGEIQGKNVFQYIAQYMYYIVEVVIVLLIIIYGQKAFESLLKKETAIPLGGIVLAMTWGIFHFVSRGVGIEVWNGVSCIIFSILSGIMYLKLDRNYLYSHLFIAIGYLL